MWFSVRVFWKNKNLPWRQQRTEFFVSSIRRRWDVGQSHFRAGRALNAPRDNILKRETPRDIYCAHLEERRMITLYNPLRAFNSRFNFSKISRRDMEKIGSWDNDGNCFKRKKILMKQPEKQYTTLGKASVNFDQFTIIMVELK